jgi:hypothetical protein
MGLVVVRHQMIYDCSGFGTALELGQLMLNFFEVG